MWFWWFIFICDLLVPITMFIGGAIMTKHHPKEINSLLGYSTARSMQNMDTWKFAHSYCGRIWWKIGLTSLIITVLSHLPFYHSNENIIGVVSLVAVMIQLIILFIPIFITENALKKTFNEDGTRR